MALRSSTFPGVEGRGCGGGQGRHTQQPRPGARQLPAAGGSRGAPVASEPALQARWPPAPHALPHAPHSPTAAAPRVPRAASGGRRGRAAPPLRGPGPAPPPAGTGTDTFPGPGPTGTYTPTPSPCPGPAPRGCVWGAAVTPPAIPRALGSHLIVLKLLLGSSACCQRIWFQAETRNSGSRNIFFIGQALEQIGQGGDRAAILGGV